jgi:hypothetical protein
LPYGFFDTGWLMLNSTCITRGMKVKSKFT